jgi:predicted nucleic acid-binding protein
MTYLDTSAMIRAWRLKLAPAQLTRAHSVAEFYGTLTRGLTVTIQGVKTRVQFPPKVVAEGAAATFAAMKFKDLTGQQALEQLGFAAKDNVQSANLHDWMHAAVAAQAGCREIVTTNEKHFKAVTNLKLTDPAVFFAKS